VAASRLADHVWRRTEGIAPFRSDCLYSQEKIIHGGGVFQESGPPACFTFELIDNDTIGQHIELE
jgi:hypothetical protein